MGKKGLPLLVGWLSMAAAAVVEISSLISELLSLLLLQDPSVSLFRLIDSCVGPLLFSATSCTRKQEEKKGHKNMAQKCRVGMCELMMKKSELVLAKIVSLSLLAKLHSWQVKES